MSIHIHVYIRVYTHVYTHAYIHVYAHVYTHVYIHVYTYVYTHVYTHVYAHVYTHVYTHVYMTCVRVLGGCTVLAASSSAMPCHRACQVAGHASWHALPPGAGHGTARPVCAAFDGGEQAA